MASRIVTNCRTSNCSEAFWGSAVAPGQNSKWERRWREMVDQRSRNQLARRIVKHILDSRTPVEGNAEAFGVVFLPKSSSQDNDSRLRLVRLHLNNLALRQRELILELENLQAQEESAGLIPTVAAVWAQQLFPSVKVLRNLREQPAESFHTSEWEPRESVNCTPERLISDARNWIELYLEEHEDTADGLFPKLLLRIMKRRGEILRTLVELEANMGSLCAQMKIRRTKGNPFKEHYIDAVCKAEYWYPFAAALMIKTNRKQDTITAQSGVKPNVAESLPKTKKPLHTTTSTVASRTTTKCPLKMQRKPPSSKTQTTQEKAALKQRRQKPTSSVSSDSLGTLSTESGDTTSFHRASVKSDHYPKKVNKVLTPAHRDKQPSCASKKTSQTHNSQASSVKKSTLTGPDQTVLSFEELKGNARERPVKTRENALPKTDAVHYVLQSGTVTPMLDSWHTGKMDYVPSENTAALAASKQQKTFCLPSSMWHTNGGDSCYHQTQEGGRDEPSSYSYVQLPPTATSDVFLSPVKQAEETSEVKYTSYGGSEALKADRSWSGIPQYGVSKASCGSSITGNYYYSIADASQQPEQQNARPIERIRYVSSVNPRYSESSTQGTALYGNVTVPANVSSKMAKLFTEQSSDVVPISEISYNNTSTLNKLLVYDKHHHLEQSNTSVQPTPPSPTLSVQTSPAYNEIQRPVYHTLTGTQNNVWNQGELVGLGITAWPTKRSVYVRTPFERRATRTSSVLSDASIKRNLLPVNDASLQKEPVREASRYSRRVKGCGFLKTSDTTMDADSTQTTSINQGLFASWFGKMQDTMRPAKKKLPRFYCAS